jgi:hypothetical protein
MGIRSTNDVHLQPISEARHLISTLLPRQTELGNVCQAKAGSDISNRVKSRFELAVEHRVFGSIHEVRACNPMLEVIEKPSGRRFAADHDDPISRPDGQRWAVGMRPPRVIIGGIPSGIDLTDLTRGKESRAAR